MDWIMKNDLVDLINVIADDLIAAKDILNSLDGAIGDGDLGITMTLGFSAIKRELSSNQYDDIQQVFTDCGMAFADNAASTFGALMTTMFTRAARVMKGRDSIGPEEAAAILKAAAEGVQKRGSANLGDKTILDAMIPAADAFEIACLSGQSLLDCLDHALIAAQSGAEKTTQMLSKAGRAGWLGERTIGKKDPGAAAFVFLLESAKNYLVAKN